MGPTKRIIALARLTTVVARFSFDQVFLVACASLFSVTAVKVLLILCVSVQTKVLM